MTTTTTKQLSPKTELRTLSDKCRRGTATAAEISRCEELERQSRGVPCPSARTIWDLPIARVLFEADRRDDR